MSEDLPLIAIAVDTRTRIKALVEPTARLTGTGLVTLERARLLTGDIAAETLPEGVHEETKLTIFFSRNAGTPMMVIAVGPGKRIGRVLPELGGLLRRPLLTLERVRICKRDGELLCQPSDLLVTSETVPAMRPAGAAGKPAALPG